MALFNVDDDLVKDCGVTMEMALVEPNDDDLAMHATMLIILYSSRSTAAGITRGCHFAR